MVLSRINMENDFDNGLSLKTVSMLNRDSTVFLAFRVETDTTRRPSGEAATPAGWRGRDADSLGNDRREKSSADLKIRFGDVTVDLEGLCWRDGTSFIKHSVFAEVFRLLFKSEVFSKDEASSRRGVTKPLVTMISTNQRETKEAYVLSGYLLGLMMERCIAPIEIRRRDGMLVGTIRFVLKGATGDNHALQGIMNHQMAGEHTCVFGDHPRSQFANLEKMLFAKKKSIRSISEAHANGEALEYSGGVASLFLGSFGDDDRRLGNLEVFSDVNLHERTGSIKKLFWQFVNRMSKSEKEDLKENFVAELGRAGWMEYMDGKDWLNLLLKHEDVLVPVVSDYKVECLHLFHYFREIVLLCCHDDAEDVVGGRRALVLALHANCMALALVIKDLSERSKAEDEVDLNILSKDVWNLYLHHFAIDIAVLFETQDFSATVTQDMENYLGFAKKIAQRLTNFKDKLSFTILQRQFAEERRRRKFPDASRGEPSLSKLIRTLFGDSKRRRR
jgi:hypothetical protein